MPLYQSQLSNQFGEILYHDAGQKNWLPTTGVRKLSTRNGLLKITCKPYRTLRGFCLLDEHKQSFQITFTIWAKESNAKGSKVTVTFQQTHSICDAEVENRMRFCGYSHVLSSHLESMKIDDIICLTLSIVDPTCVSFDDNRKVAVTYFQLTRRFLKRGTFFISEVFKLRHSDCKRCTECAVEIGYDISQNHRGTCKVQSHCSKSYVSDVHGPPRLYSVIFGGDCGLFNTFTLANKEIQCLILVLVIVSLSVNPVIIRHTLHSPMKSQFVVTFSVILNRFYCYI